MTASSGLSVAIKPQATTAHQDQNLTYQLVVTNAGPSADSNVIATSLLPLNTVFVSAASSTPGQAPVLQSGQITAFLGTIAAGATSTVTIVVVPTQPAPSGLALGGSVSGNAFDPNLADNTATAQIAVQPSIGLGVSLAASPPACEVGKTVTLTAMVQNQGPSAATGVVLQIPIPSGAELVTANAAQGQTLVQGGVLLAQLGSLPVGASTMVTITLAPTAAGTATCTATATADQFNLTPAGSQASAIGQRRRIARCDPVWRPELRGQRDGRVRTHSRRSIGGSRGDSDRPLPDVRRQCDPGRRLPASLGSAHFPERPDDPDDRRARAGQPARQPR